MKPQKTIIKQNYIDEILDILSDAKKVPFKKHLQRAFRYKKERGRYIPYKMLINLSIDQLPEVELLTEKQTLQIYNALLEVYTNYEFIFEKYLPDGVPLKLKYKTLRKTAEKSFHFSLINEGNMNLEHCEEGCDDDNPEICEFYEYCEAMPRYKEPDGSEESMNKILDTLKKAKEIPFKEHIKKAFKYKIVDEVNICYGTLIGLYEDNLPKREYLTKEQAALLYERIAEIFEDYGFTFSLFPPEAPAHIRYERVRNILDVYFSYHKTKGCPRDIYVNVTCRNRRTECEFEKYFDITPPDTVLPVTYFFEQPCKLTGYVGKIDKTNKSKDTKIKVYYQLEQFLYTTKKMTYAEYDNVILDIINGKF